MNTALHIEDDADVANAHLTAQLGGRMVVAIEVCPGDDEHPSHVDITFSNGAILYITENEDGGLFVGMTGEGHRGTLQ